MRQKQSVHAKSRDEVGKKVGREGEREERERERERERGREGERERESTLDGW